MAQINTTGGQEVDHANRRYRIHADGFLFGGHCIYYDPIHAGGERLTCAGAPVIERI